MPDFGKWITRLLQWKRTIALSTIGWPLGIACAAISTVGIVWGIYWWSVAGQSLAAFDAWIERQAREQRNYECLDRAAGGFPFSLTIQCSRFTARVLDQQGGKLEFELRAPVLRMGIAHPSQVIVEAEGPFLRRGDMENPQWEARWQHLHVTLQWDDQGSAFLLERLPFSVSMHLKNVIVHRLEKAAPDLVADSIDLQWRYDSATPKTANIGVALTEAFWGTSKMPTQLTLGTQLNHFPAFSPQALQSFVKEFSFEKAEIVFTQVRFTAPQIDIALRGDVALDNQNRVKGTFTLHGTGIEQLPTLLPQTVLPDSAGLAVIGARLAVDPNRLSFAAADGRLFVSGVPVMPLAPLY